MSGGATGNYRAYTNDENTTAEVNGSTVTIETTLTSADDVTLTIRDQLERVTVQINTEEE